MFLTHEEGNIVKRDMRRICRGKYCEEGYEEDMQRAYHEEGYEEEYAEGYAEEYAEEYAEGHAEGYLLMVSRNIY